MHGLHIKEHATHTIMVVHENVYVLRVVARMAFELGYLVLYADTPEEAIALAERYRGPIDVIMIDSHLQSEGSALLIPQLTGLRPAVKVLYMKRHVHDETSEGLPGRESEAFIQMPFLPSQLARRLRLLIDPPPSSS